MEKDRRGMYLLTRLWLVLCVFPFPVYSNAYTIYWRAYVEIQYLTATNQSTNRGCECGVYGSDSPLYSAYGYVTLPTSDFLACSPNLTFAVSHTPWIALIKRGNCTYADKIRAAKKEGASAVVIYNIDGTENLPDLMSHSGAGNIVAIMIGNTLGKQITDLVKNGTEVYMNLLVGNPFRSWTSPVWVYVMSFAFFGITAIILGYFVFVVVKRLIRNRQLRIQQRELKRVAEKAIARLQVRTLRRTDPEVEAEDNSCAVCIDSFKRGDVVTNLPCSHLFHKTCIEPWLLEHQTCPMCKYDILKGEVGVEPSQESSMPPADVRFYPSSVSASLPATPAPVQYAEARPNVDDPVVQCAIQLSDPVYGVPNTRRKEHIYENPAFIKEYH